MEARCFFRENSYSSLSPAWRVYRPVKNTVVSEVSRQDEWSFQNGNARLVPSGPISREHAEYITVISNKSEDIVVHTCHNYLNQLFFTVFFCM